MGPSPHLCYYCIQNSDFRSRITCLYGSQNSPIRFLHSKQRLYPPELQVSMGPSHSSEVLCAHNSDIMTRINSLYGSQNSPVILCMKNIVISTRITSKLHGSQTSPVVLCLQNNVIRIRNTSLYGCQP